MSLCPACSTISVQSLTRELHHLPPWLAQFPNQSNKPRGMLLFHDARRLPASVTAGCPFCQLILHAILQHEAATITTSSKYPRHTLPASQSQDKIACSFSHGLTLVELPIYLQTNYDPIKPSFPEHGTPGSWHIRGVKAFVPTDSGVLVGRIRLFSTPESPTATSSDVIGRPLLPSSDSPEAFDLIHRWMRACLADHQVCRESLSGASVDESTPPALPSRVIHVGNPELSMPPRLLETAGKTGHYVALSHCWGSPAHQPLMTTEASLTDHLVGISWSTLPILYQDAIIATQRLGFEYIWIDSLCIIQDSLSDWLSESQRMGNVYHSARLTIAASHATDSTQPCFFPRPPPPAVVELPHVAADGKIEGSIFASVLFTDYGSISPESSPLAYRAWATQEWLLSRRMIFYTEESLVWSCKMITQRETGASCHITARNARWKNLIEKYSARKLSRQTDRLIALEGLRTEIAKSRVNDIYCCGLWKNSMPDQLLWYCLRLSEGITNPLGLPTWTWASTVHGVGFLDIKGAKNACRGFRYDDISRKLTVRGMLIDVSHLAVIKEASSLEKVRLKHDIGHAAVVPPHVQIILDAGFGLALGWCVLDYDGRLDGHVYSLRLMSCVTRLRDGDGDERRYKEWILLLRRVDEQSDVFERIGVGKISTTTPWYKDSEVVPVCIQ